MIAALVCESFWMGWLFYHGYPRVTSDSIGFKQPAYMRLHTPHFSVPTYTGQAPATERLNSYPATIFFYANYAVFEAFGFSQSTSLAFDLLVHLAVTTIGAVCLWRATGRELPAVLFTLVSSQWLMPIGRPEELGMLLVLVGLVALERGRAGLVVAIAALGLAGATSPGSAVVGTALLIAYDGFWRQFDRTFPPRLAALVCFPLLISMAIYVSYVWPDLADAWRQNAALRERGFYVTKTLLRISWENLFWTVSTLPTVTAALVLGGYCLWRRPEWYPRSSVAGTFVAAATIAIVVGIALNIVSQRLEYDFRHLTSLALAMLALAIGWWESRGPRFAPGPLAAAAVLLLLSLPVQRDLVRYTLAPLTWDEQSVDYAHAAQTLNEVVPPDATVGGDASVWTMIVDGRPFLSTRRVTEEHWPEYVVSATWERPIGVAQDVEDAQKLEAEYVEITPQPLLPEEGCALNLFGLKVPLARGRCDWYVRIWKRRGDVNHEPAPAPAP